MIQTSLVVILCLEEDLPAAHAMMDIFNYLGALASSIRGAMYTIGFALQVPTFEGSHFIEYRPDTAEDLGVAGAYCFKGCTELMLWCADDGLERCVVIWWRRHFCNFFFGEWRWGEVKLGNLRG